MMQVLVILFLASLEHAYFWLFSWLLLGIRNVLDTDAVQRFVRKFCQNFMHMFGSSPGNFWRSRLSWILMSSGNSSANSAKISCTLFGLL
ncbi:hypothetical protein MPTK1_Vg00270 [Marchantia polymorpha subsp. ruderalis]|uniref:Uncharacterized protein n=1 Tax=Marchantia polymorpha TaxID=3197 RepID=A0A2R6VWT9_MARPO|nr:hypothetical protein MARPO_YB0024 [Marchantia polymorpha]BBN20478.1 hypothetical protein Mp_Vg00270 [Marchantia polymorpha subsp. ruderalis]PTQ26077.1 hypothetical protein MARPO_YB0024 [Marchantia polymorpha]PTQ26078.1 hypothetical protein MARPO_YB0024 [Marchantia polymorpha]BBN20479.1 hypothetical protein Mp_Vg00270 [Marchantia polymorpha subsp. ruderalis]|eukprot:PTQ26076.1 hypothetical protein MARPO_YB0024 [Marchantia polymorpha]